MIDINIEYERKKYRDDEWYSYRKIEVIGHAVSNNGVKDEKVCAIITAIMLGAIRTLENWHWKWKVENGYVLIRRDTNCYNDLCMQANMGLNVVVCILYEVYKKYPNLINSINLINKEEEDD